MDGDKFWEVMSLTEQKTAFRDFLASEINLAFEQGLTFKPHNRAYNAYSGSAYSGLNALILDAKQQEGNYTGNAWISFEEAQRLGADAKDLEFIQNDQGSVKRAVISYIKTQEVKLLPKKNAQGNPIPLLDSNGNPRFNRKGESLFELEKVHVEIPPKLEVKYLYNVECFKSLDQTRLQRLDSKSLKPLYVGKYFSAEDQNLIIRDLSASLTREQYQRVLDYVDHCNQHGQQYARNAQQPSQGIQGHTPKPSQFTQSNQAPSNNNQTNPYNPQMTMLQAPTPPENQGDIREVIQRLQELREMMQLVQKTAQEVAWLKQQLGKDNVYSNGGACFAPMRKGV